MLNSKIITGTAFIALLVAMVPNRVFSLEEETGIEVEEKMEEMQMYKECVNKTFNMLEDERNAYRRVQYESDGVSVLGTDAETADLIPYLTLNYQALDCRLRMICEAVEVSNRYPGAEPSIPHRPIGCSRMFSARGRWWSEERGDQAFASDRIPECDYEKYADTDVGYAVVPFESIVPSIRCKEWTDQILFEERNMLKLLVAQDSVNRSARGAIGMFYATMRDIRDNSLPKLRKMVDFFGSVLHPIPCLLTQCN